MKSFQPLIYAVDAENITIKGEGTVMVKVRSVDGVLSCND